MGYICFCATKKARKKTGAPVAVGVSLDPLPVPPPLVERPFIAAAVRPALCVGVRVSDWGVCTCVRVCVHITFIPWQRTHSIYRTHK